ncbi:MAG: response regulator [Roseburia sp.]
MKKVMLVGKFNGVMRDVYRHLEQTNKYTVQVCPAQKDLMGEMIDLIEPDVVVISLMELEGSHNNLLAYLRDDQPNLKVICYGTVPEQLIFFGYLGDIYFHALTRSASHKDLLAKVSGFMEDSGEFSVVSEGPAKSGNKMEELELALQQVKKEQADSEKKKKILLVDDKAIQLRTLRSLLVNEYDVLLATNGSDALKIMQKNHPDIVFLDYEMPEMDGKDVLERIRQIEAIKNIPVVFLTGEKDKDRVMEVAKLNPAGYLLKPPDIDKIHNIIQEILGTDTGKGTVDGGK